MYGRHSALRAGPQHLVLVGGGGHAKVVFESARAGAWLIRGFVDDAVGSTLATYAHHLGAIAECDTSDDAIALILAIGDLQNRRMTIDRLVAGMFARVAHPSSVVSPSANIAAGAFIGPHACVNADADVGAHSIVNSGAVIEHDCSVGSNTHIAPRAALAGGCTVGHDTLIGIGAVVLPGISIGDNCTIGAGAAVVRDVPSGSTVTGVPAQ